MIEMRRRIRQYAVPAPLAPTVSPHPEGIPSAEASTPTSTRSASVAVTEVLAARLSPGRRRSRSCQSAPSRPLSADVARQKQKPKPSGSSTGIPFISAAHDPRQRGLTPLPGAIIRFTPSKSAFSIGDRRSHQYDFAKIAWAAAGLPVRKQVPGPWGESNGMHRIVTFSSSSSFCTSCSLLNQHLANPPPTERPWSSSSLK